MVLNMKKISSILIIALFIGCSVSVKGFSKKITDTDVESRIILRNSFRLMMFDGRIRSYLQHVPSSYDGSKPVPVVIVLHGHPGWCIDPPFFTGLNKKSDEEGFIVVYPNGHRAPGLPGIIFFLETLVWPRLWNCWDYCDIDDVGFIRALINRLDSTLNIDTSKVYITGISGGGMMTYRLGADLSDIVAAIAPVAGSNGGIWYTESSLYVSPKPANPVSVIVFHGLQDRNLPYYGGWVNGSIRLWNTNIQVIINTYFLSVNESVSFWVEHNNCDTIPEIETSPSGNIIKQTYANGTDGSEVILVTYVNGIHEWFSSPPHELSATDLMWEFFEANPKQ